MLLVLELIWPMGDQLKHSCWFGTFSIFVADIKHVLTCHCHGCTLSPILFVIFMDTIWMLFFGGLQHTLRLCVVQRDCIAVSTATSAALVLSFAVCWGSSAKSSRWGSRENNYSFMSRHEETGRGPLGRPGTCRPATLDILETRCGSKEACLG